MKSLLLFICLSVFSFGQDLNQLDSVQASQIANDFNNLNQKDYKFYKAIKSKQRPILGFIFVDPTLSEADVKDDLRDIRNCDKCFFVEFWFKDNIYRYQSTTLLSLEQIYPIWKKYFDPSAEVTKIEQSSENRKSTTPNTKFVLYDRLDGWQIENLKM
ncbi:hypothetical protein [Faecalibacter macacae]|uniref:Uncharacterized protein n=1 Tax=Faecalibacter macacae TaxID=1859289 RepID=A0A3L9M708_9FLAO|nr:hypothetical protein [Faecalibacter macacae]RLZ08581.1 hypothetical protein EAH69_09715 [Faecalibacter macacae]